MSNSSSEAIATNDHDDAQSYRALPTGAIVGLAMGMISVITLLAAFNSIQACLWLTPIPVLGMFISLRSLTKIRREPEHYTGGRMALAGLVMSLAFLAGGVGYGAYVYVNEVPPDHTRISFSNMRPDVAQERAGIIVPPEILALDGKRVFIKGFMRPPKVRAGIERFLLVRDNQQCCFGDLSGVKYYDQILVDLTGSLRLSYSDEVLAIGGVLTVRPENLAYGPRASVFSLKADYAK